jgi:NADH-quinone oxidoreductase subunit E
MIEGDIKTRIDKWIAKYPADQKQSAVMAALRIMQEHNGGHLTTEAMDAVAEYLEMPKISVYEVASFYSMYELKPVGKHKLCVCTNISCMLRGSTTIVKHLEKKLGIKLGETDKDGNYTLKEVECLGACVNAPVMQVDKEYFENLTPESVDEVLEKLNG